MIVIGVAGGIASGKSIVCRVFEDLGGIVINADVIGHETLTDPEVRDRLVEAFGREILDGEGAIHRPALGRIVFGNPAARERLNAIVHPPLVGEIRRRIDERRASGFGGVVVVDAALIVEWNERALVDVLVIVTAPEALRIERLMARNKLTLEAAAQRVASQLTDEERMVHADYVIDNSGTVEELEDKARETWKRIVKRKD